MNRSKASRNWAAAVGVFALAVIAASAFVEPARGGDADGAKRREQSLDGTWRAAFDPQDAGKRQGWFKAESFPAAARPIEVPGNVYEVEPGYDGVFWCVRDFTPSLPGGADLRHYLRFGAVGYACDVWLNGAPLGSHEGGDEIVGDCRLRFQPSAPSLLSPFAPRKKRLPASVFRQASSGKRLPASVFRQASFGRRLSAGVFRQASFGRRKTLLSRSERRLCSHPLPYLSFEVPMKYIVVGLVFALSLLAGGVAAAADLPDKVQSAVADRQDCERPNHVRLSGMIGVRLERNAANRMLAIDVDRLLEGYRRRPGRQSWDGEHVGKWLHAATLAWVYTGNEQLRAKLDGAVRQLVRCQLDDGYLGTYLPERRWTEWDVWAHKYNLIGLITYMRYTGDTTPLPACRKMADLLCATFGDGSGGRDILLAGEHVGMAPTSGLEPMVWLYRLTGEPRYREFCKYILRAWEQPNGPKIVSRLLALGRVDKVGNGKAYEMLSCINGLLEWYRVCGDGRYLQAAVNAWEDIVAKRLYLTGTASYGELFHDDFDLPNTGNVGETCVTVTWLQFNAHLLRLTGRARYAEQLERVVYNQLCGAQRPDGRAWGYYVQMEGKKPYSDTLDGHCCLSSGPRGMALTPTFAVTTDADGVVVNLLDAGSADLRLRSGKAVKLAIDTAYPADGRIAITVQPQAETEFTLRLRIPAWCKQATLAVNGAACSTAAGADGYTAMRRVWKPGDRVALNLTVAPRVIVGEHRNRGKAAVLYGPLVLAADEALLGGERLGFVALENMEVASLKITPQAAPQPVRDWPHAQAFRVRAVSRRTGKPLDILMVPFAAAGASGSAYKVWLPLRRSGEPENLLTCGEESRSRQGNMPGSIIDGESQSPVVTFDGRPAKTDWYSVTLPEAVEVDRVVFSHGRTFHDGGWFDASSGKPRVEIRKTKDGPWTKVGELADYPATTAVHPANLHAGRPFTCRLAAPIRVVAVRVVGVPACGDNPRQAFSSCGELEAFGPPRSKAP